MTMNHRKADESMNEKRNLEKLGSEQTEFKREIGLFGGVSILGGIMIGGGIFYLGSYVLMRTGFSLGLALVCWLLGGLVSMLGGLCYAELGAMIPKAGGMTVYLNNAYHPLVGFLSGFQLLLVGAPGSLAAGALALTAMFGFGGIVEKVIASCILIAFTLYNSYGVKGSSVLQNMTMIAKLIPIAIIMFAALFMGDVTPSLSMTPMDGAVSIGTMFSMIAFATVATLWAYEGWTNLNSVAEEIKNPKKNLPLSLIIAIAGIALLYALFNFAIYRVIPLEEIHTLINNGEVYLGTEVAIRMFGAIGGTIVTVGMVISMIGSLNGMTLAFPRVPYALAEEGHFFPALKKLHPKYKIPSNALWLQCLISIALIWSRNLSQLTSLVVFSSMLFNLLVIIAVPVLRKKMPDLDRPYKVWGGMFTIALAILVNIALVINSCMEDPVTSLMGLCVPAIGVLVYLFFDRKLKKEKHGA